jgi:two-component sensor histidine kinase
VRRLVDIRLPERLARRVPAGLTEVVVGVGAALMFLALRLLLEPLTGDVAPYALAFLAVVVASLVAGWRSALIALVVGQLLTWYLLVPPAGSFAPKQAAATWGFLLATASQTFILLILTLYQREVAAARAERESRIEFLDHALREIDHRTQNNFQTVLGLLLLQLRQSAEPEVRAALTEAAARVKAVALAYGKLALSGEGLQAVRLQDHLQELCDQLAGGLVPAAVALHTELSPVTLPYEEAICHGIIVNELVTNAVKHAFPEGRGGAIRVRASVADECVVVEVADDGCGTAGVGQRRGLGTRLVEAFVRRLGATHETRSDANGTAHRIVAPLPALPA